jgi:hypothetical protein
LLAEFIGVQKTDIKSSFDEITYRLPECIGRFMLCSHWGHLRFYDSWDWLMCVVDKIESLKVKNNCSNQFRVKIHGMSCEILDMFHDGDDFQKDFLHLYFNTAPTKHLVVYNACVQFVKWYNLNKDKYE